MVQSPSWEANWFAASQEIPRILWNPKVHHRTHKRTYIVFNNLKFTLKRLKRSYMFRSYDDPQGEYFVPC